MDDRYDSYCAVDPLFYDSLSSASATATGIGYAADRPQPAGWESEVKDDWLIYAPVGGTLPAQGWKIHVSARLDNAERVLTQVMDYCSAARHPVQVPARPPDAADAQHASTPAAAPAASSSPSTRGTTPSWS